MLINLYQLRVSCWLDCNPNTNTNPNHEPKPKTNPKEGKKEMLRLKCVFETYFEVAGILWRGRQAGVKNIFVCKILGSCRRIWCLVECPDMQRYILREWQAGAKTSLYV